MKLQEILSRLSEVKEVKGGWLGAVSEIKLLTVNGAAALLRLRPERVYDPCKQSLLPHVHVGRQVRIQGERLAEWIAAGGHAFNGGCRKNNGDPS